jgi:hypothetical protein
VTQHIVYEVKVAIIQESNTWKYVCEQWARVCGGMCESEVAQELLHLGVL